MGPLTRSIQYSQQVIGRTADLGLSVGGRLRRAFKANRATSATTTTTTMNSSWRIWPSELDPTRACAGAMRPSGINSACCLVVAPDLVLDARAHCFAAKSRPRHHLSRPPVAPKSALARSASSFGSAGTLTPVRCACAGREPAASSSARARCTPRPTSHWNYRKVIASASTSDRTARH